MSIGGRSPLDRVGEIGPGHPGRLPARGRLRRWRYRHPLPSWETIGVRETIGGKQLETIGVRRREIGEGNWCQFYFPDLLGREIGVSSIFQTSSCLNSRVGHSRREIGVSSIFQTSSCLNSRVGHSSGPDHRECRSSQISTKWTGSESSRGESDEREVPVPGHEWGIHPNTGVGLGLSRAPRHSGPGRLVI
jgi:hypothetical protein